MFVICFLSLCLCWTCERDQVRLCLFNHSEDHFSKAGLAGSLPDINSIIKEAVIRMIIAPQFNMVCARM